MASEKITKFVEDIKTLSVLELSELVDAIQEEFGVTAAIAAATAVAVAGPAAAAEEVEEKTEFDVVLKSFGTEKIKVIKVAREQLGLGLKEAKEIVEAAPKAIKEGVSEAEANELKAKFEEAGATIEIK